MEIQEDSIKSIFEMMKFFFDELIYFQKIDIKNKTTFLNIFNKKSGIKKFFEIYLVYDFPSAFNLLEKIIFSTISEIKSPFYLKLLDYENIIDQNDPNNNKKIINEILKVIIKAINERNDFGEIINNNKEKLLLILYLIILKEKNIITEFENFILNFIMVNFDLQSPKIIQLNFFYCIKEEYFYFFESLLNVLFEYLELHNYDNKYLPFINGFLLSSAKSSFFGLNDLKLINNQISENILNIKRKSTKQKYFPNILNSLYFLIYFFSKKNKNIIQDPNKESFINDLIKIFFNNCCQVFEIINRKKIAKKFIIKSNIPNLEIYNYLYNIFTTKDKNELTLNKIENFYKQKCNEIFGVENSNNNLSNSINYYNKPNISDEITIKSEETLNNNNNHLENKRQINENNNINEKIKEENFEINNITDLEPEKKFDLKTLLKKEDIPLIYFNKLVSVKKSNEITKVLSNPKAEFIWKTFIFSLKDMIFYSKDFVQLSKSFKMFSRDYLLETSSPEENEMHLNYPTKMKNFICNDYYRPFLKPYIKFFKDGIIKLSHNYVPPNKLEKIRNKEDFFEIYFIKYIPINFDKNEQKEIICENISYRGSVLGKIILKQNFLVFIDDYYNLLDKCRANPLFFALAFKDYVNQGNIKSKKILIFYKDIKEIMIRRFFLKRIGYEIFLKNGRSYLFNFFNSENFNKFQSDISKKGIVIINDLVKNFEKKDFKNKFKRGELSNFQYLLQLNKYTTRTYNDLNQYLVFPTIYINIQKNKKRDLSKAICLNKDEDRIELGKYRENYRSQGYHFNNHYSTSAFVLYYLVRLVPYTHLLIDFQSLKFDIPERIFSNYNTYSSGILNSNENRELLPEIFHCFEMCLNINHINVGKFNFSNNLINNFNSNKYKTCIEFIINHRIALEEANIVPWINNIFGFNQLNETEESYNVFQITSYEQKFEDNNVQKEKSKDKNKNKSDYEIFNEIRLNLAILDLGITPMQLFKSPHPEKIIDNNSDINNINNLNKSSTIKPKSSKNLGDINNNNLNINNISKKEKKLQNDKNKIIKQLFSNAKRFNEKQQSKKYKLYLNEETMNLFYIYKNQISIINIYSTDPSPKIKYPINLNLSNNLVTLESEFYDNPSNNILIELMPGYYCICRNENKTLKFMNFTQKFEASFLWTSVITSIELYSHKIDSKFSGSDNSFLIFFGDEEGYSGMFKLECEYLNRNNEIKIKEIKILKKIKIHENCINILHYEERLNIIVSSSLNGDIAINNAYSLEILNIIKIGKNFLINDIKISLYDLLYVESYNNENKNYYLMCYTLNGIKATEFNIKTKIVNFIINKNIYVFYENKIIDKFYMYDFKTYYKNDENDNLIDAKTEKFKNKFNKIIHCKYSKKLQKVIKILDNNILEFEDFCFAKK